MSDEPKTRTWPEGQWTGSIRMKDRSQWQPIETVPKDTVLLYFPTAGSRISLPAIMRVGRFIDYPARLPTHWMPLPLPPEQET